MLFLLLQGRGQERVSHILEFHFLWDHWQTCAVKQ
jgi:hypothetical protein